MLSATGPLPFEEAIAWAESRGVVLPSTYYGQLQGFARAQAFSIAGRATLDQLQQVKDSLDEAIREGEAFAEWQRRASTQDLSLPAHRLDNIFRTNLQGDYARGRCEQAKRNLKARPYLLYDAVNDDRTRPAHRAMDGFTAPYDDPIWATWRPPCGYRCRCRVITLSEAEAQKFIRADQNAMRNPARYADRLKAITGGPDQGWDYDICSEPEGGEERATEDRLEKWNWSLENPAVLAALGIGATTLAGVAGWAMYQRYATLSRVAMAPLQLELLGASEWEAAVRFAISKDFRNDLQFALREDALTAILHRQATTIDQLLYSTPQTQVELTAYRSMFGIPRDIRAGAVLTENGYTTLAMERALVPYAARNGAMVEVVVPPGSHALALYRGVGAPGSFETLLPRGARVRVVSSTEWEGLHRIKGELDDFRPRPLTVRPMTPVGRDITSVAMEERITPQARAAAQAYLDELLSLDRVLSNPYNLTQDLRVDIREYLTRLGFHPVEVEYLRTTMANLSQGWAKSDALEQINWALAHPESRFYTMLVARADLEATLIREVQNRLPAAIARAEALLRKQFDEDLLRGDLPPGTVFAEYYDAELTGLANLETEWRRGILFGRRSSLENAHGPLRSFTRFVEEGMHVYYRGNLFQYNLRPLSGIVTPQGAFDSGETLFIDLTPRSLPASMEVVQGKRVVTSEVTKFVEAAKKTKFKVAVSGGDVTAIEESKLLAWKQVFGDISVEEVTSVYATIAGETPRLAEITLYPATQTARIKVSSTAGQVVREFNLITKTVEHEYFAVPFAAQGKDFAKAFFRKSLDLYAKLGIEKIRLVANIDVGGYAWARYGAVPTEAAWAHLRNILERKVQRALAAIEDQATSEEDFFLGAMDSGWAQIQMLLDEPVDSELGHPIWQIADSPIGKEVLLGTTWNGVFDLTDPAVMERLNAYIGRGL